MGTPALVSAQIVSLGSGWYRIGLTGQLPSDQITAAIRVATGDTDTFAGDGTSGILVYGPQLTQGVDLRTYAPTTSAILGPVLFNPPMALTPGGVELWGAIAGGPNWGGCNVWVSYDGSDYQQIGSTAQGSARFGQLTASYASGADPDTTDTLSVDMSPSGAVLTSATTATADAGGTLALIDDELVGYSTATLTSGDAYDLTTYVRRGVLNTTIAAHSIGAEFVRLDDAIFKFPYLAVQAGVAVDVKFQSFNLWGEGVQDLTDCIAYTIVPIPLGARTPGSSAWSAVGTQLSNAGQSIPALVITGTPDNPSAQLVDFFYRVTGTSTWAAAGSSSISTPPTFMRKEIVSVQSGQNYDVAVAYSVNGNLTALQQLSGGPFQAGSVATGPSGGGSGATPGTTLLNDSTAGSGNTFTCPTGSYAHVDIVLTGFPGAGNGQLSGSKTGGYSTVDRGGGGAGVVIAKGFPVTPGSTVITYTLPSAVGSDATATATGLSLTAHPGTNATTSASGAGAAASTGNSATGATSVTAYAGRNGGLTDIWDGGGPGATMAASSGTVTSPGADNKTDGSAGAISGQGGAGSAFAPQPGGGCNILIVART